MSTTGFADAASADSPTSAMPPTFASSTVPVAGTVTCAPAGWLPTIGSDVVVLAEPGSAKANAATGSDLSLPVRLRRVRLPLSIVRNAVESTVNAAYPFGTVTTVPAVSYAPTWSLPAGRAPNAPIVAVSRLGSFSLTGCARGLPILKSPAGR